MKLYTVTVACDFITYVSVEANNELQAVEIAEEQVATTFGVFVLENGNKKVIPFDSIIGTIDEENQ
jgi:hypothetical protein